MGFLYRLRRGGRPNSAVATPLPATSVPPTPPAEIGGLEILAGGADRIAVVDCETTGVYDSDRVVEIAIVTLDLDGYVIDSWDTLIQPQRDVGASHIHGLTAEMLVGAPTFPDVAGDVAVRLHGACIAAHNLPFDVRMIGSEFVRIGAEMTVIDGIDTLTATGCRLGVACETHGVAIQDAHSALGDATATAALLLQVAAGCVPGAPAAAPAEMVRAGMVLRRADIAPVAIPDPPHVIRLAATLDHAGLEANMIAYLELVDRAVADVHLDKDERRQLAELAGGLGLNAAQRAQAHRRFVNDLTDAALDDDVVTDDELDTLLRIAAALEVDTKFVEQRTRPARTTSVLVMLTEGMNVTFTGDDPDLPRDQLVARATDLGFSIGSSVTKKTELLIAYDTASNSGKTAKARSYDVPIVSTSQFAEASLGDRLEAQATAGTAMKVVTCPDCHANWTVEARSGAQSRRRCDDCLSVPTTSARPRSTSKSQPTEPVIEELTCSECGKTWTRERLRGRKPHRCPDCIT